MSEPAAEVVVTRRMRQRRDTAANWTAKNPILGAGEIGFEVVGPGSAPLEKIGDGVTAWAALPYRSTTLAAKAVSITNLDDALRVGVVRRYVAGSPVTVQELYLYNGHLYEAQVTQAQAGPPVNGALDPAKFRDVSGQVDLSKLLPLPSTAPAREQVATVAPLNGAPAAGYRDARDVAELNVVVSEKYRDGAAPLPVSGLVSVDFAAKAVGARTLKITPTAAVQLTPSNVDPASLSTAQVVVVQGDTAYPVTAVGAAAQDTVDQTPGTKIVLSFLCLGDGTFVMRAIETIKVVTYADRMRATTPAVWYPMTELSGTVAADASGNGRNGVYFGNPALGQPSLVGADVNGHSVLFDGLDDYVQVDALAGSGIIDMTKDWTVGLLFDPQGTPAVVTSPPQVRALLTMAQVTQGAETNTLFSVTAQTSVSYDRLRLIIRNSQGTNYVDTSTTVTPYDVANGPYAVWLVHDSVAHTIKPLYATAGMVNPASAGPTATVTIPPAGTFAPSGATIGARRVAGAVNNYFAGYIGPVEAWGRALTDAEIRAIWADWKGR